MTLSPGTRFGPYETVALLGAGGMGEVFKARDVRLGRDVAVKVLPAGLSHDPARRERFEQEARLIAALSHPHICALYDVGDQDGVHFLVMEYLEGETLAQRLARSEPQHHRHRGARQGPRRRHRLCHGPQRPDNPDGRFLSRRFSASPRISPAR
jgi:serine/threonine protein kinase